LLAAGAAAARFSGNVVTGLLPPLVALLVVLLVGFAVFRRRGLRLVEGRSRAADWPRGRLALACGAAVALLLMTFWNLDLAVRQRLAAVHIEAGNIGLSVAPPRVPDRQNAALVYQRAFDAMASSSDWPQHEVLGEEYLDGESDFDFVKPEITAFLQSQQPAIRLLRQAAEMPGCYFERPFTQPNIGILLPEIQNLREAARLLALDARNQAARGDRQAALADARTILALADHTASDPFLMSALASYALQSMAFTVAQNTLARHVASAEELAQFQSAPAPAARSILQRALRMEEAVGLASFSAARFDNPLGTFAPPGSPVGLAGVGPFFRVFLLSRDLDAYRAMMSRYQQIAPLPFYEAEQKIGQVERDLRADRGGILTSLVLPALSGTYRAAAMTEARQDVLRTALAMHAYRAQHEKFPDALDALAPEFLPRVPTDPFTGEPLLLQTTKRGWTVYSVGPDKFDEGGTPLRYKSIPYEGDIGFFFKQ
jgi:hypothetical protein